MTHVQPKSDDEQGNQIQADYPKLLLPGPRITLATGANLGYLPTLKRYLESVEQNSLADENIVFVVGGQSACDGKIQFRSVMSVSAPNPNHCLQHGAFLPYHPGLPNDIIVFTDGDMTLQRWFVPEEIERIAAMTREEIGLGWNAGPADTLALEAERIEPRAPRLQLGSRLPGDWSRMVAYNTGVIIARRDTYEDLFRSYLEWHQVVESSFGNYARQQWLICYLVATMRLRVWQLPYEMHTQNHYPLPEGCHWAGQLFCFKGTPVMFRHRI